MQTKLDKIAKVYLTKKELIELVTKQFPEGTFQGDCRVEFFNMNNTPISAIEKIVISSQKNTTEEI